MSRKTGQPHESPPKKSLQPATTSSQPQTRTTQPSRTGPRPLLAEDLLPLDAKNKLTLREGNEEEDEELLGEDQGEQGLPSSASFYIARLSSSLSPSPQRTTPQSQSQSQSTFSPPKVSVAGSPVSTLFAKVSPFRQPTSSLVTTKPINTTTPARQTPAAAPPQPRRSSLTSLTPPTVTSQRLSQPPSSSAYTPTHESQVWQFAFRYFFAVTHNLARLLSEDKVIEIIKQCDIGDDLLPTQCNLKFILSQITKTLFLINLAKFKRLPQYDNPMGSLIEQHWEDPDDTSGFTPTPIYLRLYDALHNRLFDILANAIHTGNPPALVAKAASHTQHAINKAHNQNIERQYELLHQACQPGSSLYQAYADLGEEENLQSILEDTEIDPLRRYDDGPIPEPPTNEDLLRGYREVLASAQQIAADFLIIKQNREFIDNLHCMVVTSQPPQELKDNTLYIVVIAKEKKQIALQANFMELTPLQPSLCTAIQEKIGGFDGLPREMKDPILTEQIVHLCFPPRPETMAAFQAFVDHNIPQMKKNYVTMLQPLSTTTAVESAGPRSLASYSGVSHSSKVSHSLASATSLASSSLASTSSAGLVRSETLLMSDRKAGGALRTITLQDAKIQNPQRVWQLVMQLLAHSKIGSKKLPLLLSNIAEGRALDTTLSQSRTVQAFNAALLGCGHAKEEILLQIHDFFEAKNRCAAMQGVLPSEVYHGSVTIPVPKFSSSQKSHGSTTLPTDDAKSRIVNLEVCIHWERLTHILYEQIDRLVKTRDPGNLTRAANMVQQLSLLIAPDIDIEISYRGLREACLHPENVLSQALRGDTLGAHIDFLAGGHYRRVKELINQIDKQGLAHGVNYNMPAPTPVSHATATLTATK